MQELLKTYPQLSQQTLAFLAKKHGHFIHGRVEHGGSDEPIDIHDPATGLRIAQCSAGGAAEIDAAVTAGRLLSAGEGAAAVLGLGVKARVGRPEQL